MVNEQQKNIGEGGVGVLADGIVNLSPIHQSHGVVLLWLYRVEISVDTKTIAGSRSS